MAQLSVSLAIEKLVSLLAKEVKLLRGIHGGIADIKDDLESNRAFLKDADAKAEKEEISEGVKEWVKQVREAAYRTEDLIDEYALKVTQFHDQHGFKGFLNRLTSYVRSLKARYEIASDIQHLKKSLREIKERSERYKFTYSEQGVSSNIGGSVIPYDPRVGSRFIKETELVGIEYLKDELICQLVEGTSQRVTISVVGMGGVGKTTLVKKVYDNQRVIAHFDCHAWITVSQCYKKDELLRSILKQFYEEREVPFPKKFETMEYLMLIAELSEYLQRRRYLVVFDDIGRLGFGQM